MLILLASVIKRDSIFLVAGAIVRPKLNLSAEEEVYNWLLIGKKTGVLESAGEKRH